MPPLFDVPIPEAVDLMVAVPGASEPPPADAKAGKGGGKGSPADPTGKPPQSVMLSAVEALVASLCQPLEAPPQPELAESATAEMLRAASWTSHLQQTVVGERAKLRRRLVSTLRAMCGSINELKSQVQDLYTQLDAWLGERITKESEATSVVVGIMRRAIEREGQLPRALQLQGDTLIIDDSLLLLPPPPPPPVPPPAQLSVADRFTAAQLAGLAAKLRAGSTGQLISAEGLTTILSRLASASFDAASVLVPEAWLPLGSPAFSKLSARFCAPGSQQLGWPELVIALADLEPITEAGIVETLHAAASIAGREDLLPPPADADNPNYQKNRLFTV